MSQQQSNSSNSNTDHTANFFWFLAFLTIVVLVIWWYEHAFITKFIFFLRHYEIAAVEWVVKGYNALAQPLHLPLINDSQLRLFHNYIDQTPINEVKFSDVAELSEKVGVWIRWPIVAVLIGLSLFMFFRHRESRFRKTYDMDTLKKVENQNWPQITPVLSLNLLKIDLDEGPWAMAKLPMDFCKSNDLLMLTEDKNKNKIWSLKRNQAERAFVMQMGPLWRGIRSLPIHVKALVVIFLAKIHRQNDISDQLLSQIAHSAANVGRLNFSGVEKLISDYEKSKALTWAQEHHAYVATVMATLLEMSRAEGVFASAEFLWLKPVDRRLWYMLNSIGRRTVVVEAAGLFAHWLAEKSLRRSLSVPMVKEAVNALEVAAQDVLYIPEGEKWHISTAV